MTDRIPNDFYETPRWVVDAILRELRLPAAPQVIYDPHCGAGALLHASHEVWPDATCVGDDIAPQIESSDDDYWLISERDTIKSPRHPGFQRTITIMNPPYKHAIEAMEAIVPTHYQPVIALLPIGLLSGIGRSEIWRRIGMPDWIRVVAPRPKFRKDRTGGGAYDVAWHGWRCGINGGPIGRVERKRK